MLGPMSTGHEQTKRIAILCIIAFVAANAVFYFLSDSYFASHRQVVPGKGSVPAFSPEQVTAVRTWFGVFTGTVAVAAFLAGVWTRVTAHLLTALLGALTLTACAGAFFHTELTKVLGATLLIAGVLLPVLTWQSYFRRARPAWAFLIAICGVFAVAELFGAPKVARGLGISLWITMTLPGLNAVAAFALASLRDEYIERNSGTA
jgi:hypothetical protein